MGPLRRKFATGSVRLLEADIGSACYGIEKKLKGKAFYGRNLLMDPSKLLVADFGSVAESLTGSISEHSQQMLYLCMGSLVM